MSDIRTHLDGLAASLEKIANTPQENRAILDRELSGNKIHGGTITNFASQGIKDEAKSTVVVIKDDGIHVDIAHISTVQNSLAVKGDLKVTGTVHAQKMHVEEVTADVRHERSDPLSFVNANNSVAYGKGLVWPGGDYTKQFILQQRPDRFFSTESIDLNQGKSYYVGGQEVLSQNSLGNSVITSNLKQLGTLSKLNVDGFVNIDNYIIYDANTQRLGIGTEEPNGALSIANFDHEFVIDSDEENEFTIGSYTTTGINLVTDNTSRINISESGTVLVRGKTVFKEHIGVGVTNFSNDADITTAGPVRFEGKKFEVSGECPVSGNYNKGDIVWNSDPRPTGYVGWVCVTSGNPGVWKQFGPIAS